MHHSNCFVAKAKNYVTVLFLFCRKHTIQCVPRFWHLPTRWGMHMIVPFLEQNGFSRSVSFSLVVLWWHTVGGLETNRFLFSVTWWDITTVVVPFLFFSYRRVHPMQEKYGSLGLFKFYLLSAFFWWASVRNNWIVEFQFYFWLIPVFCTNLPLLYCTIIVFHNHF